MENIQDYLTKKLQKLEVIYPQTLFEPSWKNLDVCRCPLCGNKLKLSKRKIWICGSKKHAKPYIVTERRMEEIRKRHDTTNP